VYGLAAAVFSQDINRALQTAHKLKAGTAWVNCVNTLYPNVPFGGYKQSGMGRELGEYALHQYVSFLPSVGSVTLNLFTVSSQLYEREGRPGQLLRDNLACG